MTAEDLVRPVTVDPGDILLTAARRMNERVADEVVVVEPGEAGRLVSVISHADILSAHDRESLPEKQARVRPSV